MIRVIKYYIITILILLITYTIEEGVKMIIMPQYEYKEPSTIFIAILSLIVVAYSEYGLREELFDKDNEN